MASPCEYRANAAQQREAAAATSLPLVKSRLLDAAERWDQLAEEVERFALRPRRRNEMYY